MTGEEKVYSAGDKNITVELKGLENQAVYLLRFAISVLDKEYQQLL